MTDAAPRPANVIRDFWTIETAETVAVIVKSDQPLTYTAIPQEDPRGVCFQFPATALEGLDAAYFPPPNNVFTLDNPARIVFDFMGLHSTFKGEQRIPVRSQWVSQVRHLGYPDKVRLVAETEARFLRSYSMEPTPDGLVITVGAQKP